MPQLFHGGAETQFRRLFENLENCYITALSKSSNSIADEYKDKYRGRILELNNPFENALLYQIKNYWNILKSLIIYKNKIVENKVLIIYGAGTKWLLLYPFVRFLNYKIIYSERNDGHHRLKLLYHIMGHCDYVTTNSIEAKNVISQYLNKKIHVINNGIFIPKYNSRLYTIHNPLRILVPARIHRLKNQIIVVEALKDVIGIEVHFAGSVDDTKYYGMIRDIILNSNCEDKFLFDGFVDDMITYFANFDLVLLPSFSEGTPNVLLESMAFQIPCIASNISMNARLIKDSRFMFAPDDIISLQSCINNFRNLSSEEIGNVILNNYQYVKNNYSVELMVESFRNLINTL